MESVLTTEPHSIRNHILVDYENVQPKSLDLIRSEHFTICVFVGPQNLKLPTDLVQGMLLMGARATLVRLVKSGKNALDALIILRVAKIKKEEPGSHITVISNDKGFDPYLENITNGASLMRCSTIERMPCFCNQQPGLPVLSKVKKTVSKVKTSNGTESKKITLGVDAQNNALNQAIKSLFNLALETIKNGQYKMPKNLTELRNYVMTILKTTKIKKMVDKEMYNRLATRVRNKLFAEKFERTHGRNIRFLGANQRQITQYTKREQPCI